MPDVACCYEWIVPNFIIWDLYGNPDFDRDTYAILIVDGVYLN